MDSGLILYCFLQKYHGSFGKLLMQDNVFILICEIANGKKMLNPS